ncbi:MAG: rod-binding protein [Planctomycetaceae bacterium]
MTIPPLSASLGPDINALSQADVSGPAFESAVQEFEGIFISMMLKEMRKTVGDGFFGGDKADAIGGLFDMTLGEELGRNGGLGIAAALARYRNVAQSIEIGTPSTGASIPDSLTTHRGEAT